MRASTVLGAAAVWGVAVTAIPAAPVEERDGDLERNVERHLEKRVDQTALWVSIDDNGQPATTYTPSITTVSGTTSAINGAPHDLTASLYTRTNYGVITTSTGSPPNPTSTGKGGSGAFTRCFNTDGDNAPFCNPAPNSTLLTGNTYYVTWDPDFYNTSTTGNTTYEIILRLDYLNRTSGDMVKLAEFDRVPAKWGFSPLKMSSNYVKNRDYTNITITLLSSVSGSAAKNESASMPVIFKKPSLPEPEPSKAPQGDSLTIALPTVFGAIVLFVIGGCLWNRKTRRIQLGSVMGRNRSGYTGRSSRRRMLRRKSGGIQLDTRPVTPADAADFHDLPDMPRRDSDALGSLAGTPTRPAFQEQGTTGGSNAFRDELRRQERDMF